MGFLRRICGFLPACIGAAAFAVAASASGPISNAVELENAAPGTAGALTPATGGNAVAGYATEVSALPGDTLHLHVSTSAGAPYRVEVYRLGWYGGAGVRLVGCTPSCTSYLPGRQQPPPAVDASGLVRAGWPVTSTFVLPPDAVSGYYRVRFVLQGGQSASTYVIVRSPEPSRSAILVQVPVNTWEAYNGWGGRSLYDLPGVAAANRVSFDRPYAWNAPGNQNPLGWEYPLVLFLEQNGYDVSYQTDVDTDQNPGSLLEHRLVIVAGHDEYWTQAMRDAFDAARDAGVNLAFMGANDAYWRVRYEDGGQTIVDYKGGDDPVEDPAAKTGLFRLLGEQECKLIGIQHQGGKLDWPSGDYAVVGGSLDNPWFRGTGFRAGDTIAGVAGVETDTIPQWDHGASCGQALTVFFHRERGGDQLGNADATAYVAPSGATVFAAGSKRFVWGLADPPPSTGRAHGLVDPRLQRFVRNMLDDLSARRTARLTVSLSAKTHAVRVGRRLHVLATITNQGPDPAPAADLELTIPPGLALVRIGARRTRCTLAPVHCRLPALASGATTTADFTLRATAAGPCTLAARADPVEAANPDTAASGGDLTLSCLQPPG